MNLKPFLVTITSLFFLYVLITVSAGCAGITPPTGGPRDSLPPVLLRVNPADSTLRFAEKKIQLEFDEYVQVEELQKNFLVNPTPKITPTVEQKLKTITVTIRDTLEENTTYALDFGNAIRDINEGNILRGYRYIFSTGTSLDSLELAGRVIVARTGRPDSTLIVMLHSNLDDSAVVKDRPRYVTRLDSSGNFRFRNLAPGTFDLYALKDEGGQRKYLSKDQLFAFADSAITTQSQRQDLTLYAYQALDTGKTSGIGSLRQPPKIPEDAILKVQTSLSGEMQDLLSPLTLTFQQPLEFFDTAKVQLTDASFNEIPRYTFQRDTTGKKVSIVHAWTENTEYRLLLDTVFARDTLGLVRPLPDTLSFRTRRNAEYGLIDLRFFNLPLDRQPVLQFIQGDEVKQSHVFTSNRFQAKLFPPGDYELRIVFDTNRNGVWDTGEFFGEKRQPEKVMLIPRRITVRPNWDNEIDIQL